MFQRIVDRPKDDRDWQTGGLVDWWTGRLEDIPDLTADSLRVKIGGRSFCVALHKLPGKSICQPMGFMAPEFCMCAHIKTPPGVASTRFANFMQFHSLHTPSIIS